ncbi:hypothetical protein [Bosea sp. ASV33]|uniref:hypothetical protein n=1 Tax=Bosea sp. ASV33 TaxID=2795106 RepID=UPI0018ECC76E|nr:hypothetical protein [Bosea sp. ASV33]
MVEAFDILARSGTRVGPRQHANGWPAMIHEFSDLVDAQARALAEKEKQQERAARPTADELSRMNEALKWPMAYLDGRPLPSDAMMLWAYATALGRDMAAMLHHRKKRAMALADEMMRRHNAPPHRDDKGAVKDTREPAVIEAHERRAAIAREVAGLANAEMAKANLSKHAEIRVQARAVFMARCREAGCLPLQVKPHEAMPGRCLSRTNLDRQRKIAAATVATGLRRAGIAVR